MDYNSENRFGEFKRILENDNNVSILSHEFYISYCRSKEISFKDHFAIKEILEELFPKSKFQVTNHSDFHKIISIISPNKDMIFGYAGMDQFNRVCLLPHYGQKFIFQGVHNQEKFDSYINSQYVTSRNSTVNHYNRTTASYLNNWLDFSNASDLELNFVVNYPNPIDRGKYVVNSFCWNTKLTDNFINIE